MIVLEEYSQRLNQLNGLLKEAGESLDVAALKAKQKELQSVMSKDDFWQDIAAAHRINKQLKETEDKIAQYEGLVKKIDDTSALIELVEEENDEVMAEEIHAEVRAIEKEIQDLHIATLLRGQYDSHDAILTLHAGAGGTESQDWVSMLYRMYTRHCEKKRYKVKVLDYIDGDEAGIKSVTFEVDGTNAYGYLKAEKGVHRLVRISPFDASARRHTSFASLDVMPVIEDDVELEINPDDLRIDTYRSSGAGGQHVNKTDSAIRITHLPTGIVVQCQNERSQMQNKETAMRMLKSKLLEIKEREQMEKLSEIKGELKKIEWGSQIRSYVFHPYSMVKDHRTGEETGNINAVMDGELDNFIQAYLRKS
ncbi:MAG: peptide chain release factor 2 [Christensenellales bacterium]